MSMNRVICMAVVGIAVQAWPCSGDTCTVDGEFAHIDGGVPSNFLPLLLTNHWHASTYPNQGVQLRQSDGGLVATQVRVLDDLSIGIETPLLVEGERYQLSRLGGCHSWDAPAPSYTHDFTVLPPMALPTNGLGISVG